MDGREQLYEKYLDGWRIIKKIGGGSLGKTCVYQIEKQNATWVENGALKVISIMDEGGRFDMLSEEDRNAYQRELERRREAAENELQTMDKLKNNHNILAFHSHKFVDWQDEEEERFGCDLLIRMDLMQCLRGRNGQLTASPEDAVKVGIDVCKALAECHRQNIIHRDVKPENIFMNSNGEYMLGDFGISRSLNDSGFASTGICTEAYAAPELLNAGGVGGQSMSTRVILRRPQRDTHKEEYGYTELVDIYSLGLTLYEICNDGCLPFVEKFADNNISIERRLKREEFPPPKRASAELSQIILKACAYQPEDRYKSASQMQEALESLLRAMQELIEKTGNKVVLSEEPAAEDTTNEVALSEEPAEDTADDATPSEESTEDTGKDEALPEESTEDTGNNAALPEEPIEKKENEASLPEKPPECREFDTELPKEPSESKKNGATQLREPTKDRPKKKKGMGVAICAAVLIVIALAASSGGKRERPSTTGKNEPNGESVPASTGTLDIETAGEELIWSDWADHLPADINGENSAIQCKLQYRSTPLCRIVDGNPQEEGYIILRTEYGEGYGGYTWKENPNLEDESIEVDYNSIQYQYYYLVEFVPDKPGIYIIPDPTPEYYWSTWQGESKRTKKIRYLVRPRQRIDVCYRTDEWGEFTDELLLPSDEIVVNTRMQYRYAEAENGQIIANSSMENFPTFTVDYAGRFADVDDATAWYGAKNSDALRTVSELGILLPDSNLRFHPDDPITVGQTIRAAVMIQRIYQGREALLAENNGQYDVYADYAIESGIIARGEFVDLSKAVMRQELAYILSGSLPAEELQERFTIERIKDMDSRFHDYALNLAKAGIVNLGNENTFRPDDTASRAEVASMIDRLIYPDHRLGRIT